MTEMRIAPNFDRLNYFYGQLLGHHQFLAEQSYFREKLKLHNRCFVGFGVVCGLDIELPPTTTPPATTPGVQIDPGLALDVCGNELVVRDPIVIPDITTLLTAAEKAGLSPQGSTIWLQLCYQERGIEPTRPVLPDACGGSGDCLYGMTREQVCVKATTTQPPTPTGGCCTEPPEPGCLTIARLDGVVANQPLTAAQIETDVRGLVGIGSGIVGVGWQHGASYLATPDVATLMGDSVAATGGLRVGLSAPVFVDSVDRNAVDVVILRPATGEVLYVDGFTTADATTAGDPTGTARGLTYRRNTSLPGAPSPKSGDRVLVTVRAALLLDTSCRPIDGANAGGRVPSLPGAPTPQPGGPTPPTSCVSRPLTSGAGGASNFESWFWVK